MSLCDHPSAEEDAGANTAARSLSGGNLQKFILYREILQNPKTAGGRAPDLGRGRWRRCGHPPRADRPARCRRGDSGDLRRPRRAVPDQRPHRCAVQRAVVAAGRDSAGVHPSLPLDGRQSSINPPLLRPADGARHAVILNFARPGVAAFWKFFCCN